MKRQPRNKMDSHPKNEVASKGDGQVPAELMAELAREVARNSEAVRIVKEKEIQATQARDRAADSHRRMNDMMQKYEDMRQKLEWTQLTLTQTTNQMNKHDMSRAGEIRSTVTRLKERAENCSGKLRQIRELNESAERISTHLTVNDDSIELVPLEDDGGLTDAEKMLLLMCQQEASAKKKENEDVVEPSEKEEKKGQEEQGGLTDAEKMLLLICQQEASARKIENKEATGPIEDEAQQVQEKQQASDVEHVSEKDNINCIPEIKTDTQGLLTILPEDSDNGGQIKLDHEDSSRKSHQLGENDTKAEITESLSIEDDLAHTLGPKAKTDTTDSSEDFDLKEITKDINQAVVNIEAKCVGVSEQLGQMAMSEQYLRTKQAQLLAKRKEKEANTALEMAAKKEQEAQEMRRKVANMMKLLEERKTKLKVTENVIDKRTNVEDKVNKLRDFKERRADFVQKRRDECVMFDVSHRSSKTNKEKKQEESAEPEEEKPTEEPKNVEEDK